MDATGKKAPMHFIPGERIKALTRIIGENVETLTRETGVLTFKVSTVHAMAV